MLDIKKKPIRNEQDCSSYSAKDYNAGNKENSSVKPAKKVLILTGLCCASCAAEIEKEVQDLQGVKYASVDFISKKLIIETDTLDAKDIIKRTAKIAKTIEPGIDVVDAGKEQDGNDNTAISKMDLIRFGTGTALFIAALVLKLPYWGSFGLYFAAYLLIGGSIVMNALKNIIRGRFFDENFLMSIATVGAFAIGEFPEGVSVMLFYRIGEFFQDMAVNHSRKSIAELIDIRPDFANLKSGDSITQVSPDQVFKGQIIIVKPGERVPLDGKVIEGRSMLDTSALTGESVPREIEAGNDILSGSINKNGLLTVEVTKEFGESTVSKILDLVQNASSKKATTEKFITKFARYYTPAVVFSALALAILPPLFIPAATFADWLNRALIFLVVSCPCALVVSIPLGFFGGIGGASKNGILIKGSNYLEALNNVDTVVFDKTGTLTKGVFNVTKIEPAGNITSESLLEYTAYAESYSSHPIALSIMRAYGKEIDKDEIAEYDEIAGNGIKAKVKDMHILAGNARFMEKENILFKEAPEIGSIVHIAVDGEYAGYIIISDEIKADSLKAVKLLRNTGVKKLIMLTGDSNIVAEKIGRDLGLDEVHAGLLPDQKVEMLELIDSKKTPKKKLVFVGDGINDAPVLARADIGVAMGGIGSDAAIEAADLVLMTDEPSRLASAIKIARKTQKIIWQNIIFALGIKAVVLILGAAGIANMWEAVFADVGVALIAVLNAMRAMKVEHI